MKRIALVNQRYGMEVNGGSEYYTRMIAERLANRYEVEVLTTKAVDYTTWKDWYVRDVEVIHGVTVRRFPVEKLRARDFDQYNGKYLQEMAAGERSLEKEHVWFEKQGPYSPACIQYIRQNKDKYDVFIFVTYLYYLTVAGMPEVAEKSIFIPTAHEEPYQGITNPIFRMAYCLLPKNCRSYFRFFFRTYGGTVCKNSCNCCSNSFRISG